MQLAGRAVLITGGRRIGHTLAVEIAARGADLALTRNRSAAGAERTAAEVRARGRRAIVVAADLSHVADCDRAVAETVEAYGRLDVLVHMASVYRETPVDAISDVDWDAALAVDLKAAFFCARAAIPHMRAAGGGRIIACSDWTAASRRPRYKGFLPYYVAKAGVIALTEALALELAGDHILVNAVAPGPIEPPEGASDEEVRRVTDATPLGRWGGAAEVARAVIGLIESDFVTGETIRIDGGRHVR